MVASYPVVNENDAITYILTNTSVTRITQQKIIQQHIKLILLMTSQAITNCQIT